MITFQRIRGVLFCISLFLFFSGLPFIISFALGYKFNRKTLRFVKTGLIYIKTQPEQAKIYLNGLLLAQNSPASIQELVPGVYKITLELGQYYPWKGEVDVEAGKASRLDKIILFPIKPDIRQLNQERFTLFCLDTQKKFIYYLDQKKKIVFRSDLDSSNFEDIASLPEESTWNYAEQISGWSVAQDNKKLFIFNPHQISVVFFDTQNDYEYAGSFVFLEYPREKIINVFWHSDNYHLIILTDKHIQVIESRFLTNPINLVELNKEDPLAFYDSQKDVLYYTDNPKKSEDKIYHNLYRLDLSTNLYLLEKLMKKANE